MNAFKNNYLLNMSLQSISTNMDSFQTLVALQKIQFIYYVRIYCIPFQKTKQMVSHKPRSYEQTCRETREIWDDMHICRRKISLNHLLQQPHRGEDYREHLLCYWPAKFVDRTCIAKSDSTWRED